MIELKKIMAMCTAITIAVTGVTLVSVSADNEMSFDIKPSTKIVEPGETFTVSIELANNTGINGWRFGLDYDSDNLELLSYDGTKGKFRKLDEDDEGNIIYTEGIKYDDQLTEDPFYLLWADGESKPRTYNGLICTFTFKVKSDTKVPSGTKSDFSLQFESSNDIFKNKLDENGNIIKRVVDEDTGEVLVEGYENVPYIVNDASIQIGEQTTSSAASADTSSVVSTDTSSAASADTSSAASADTSSAASADTSSAASADTSSVASADTSSVGDTTSEGGTSDDSKSETESGSDTSSGAADNSNTDSAGTDSTEENSSVSDGSSDGEATTSSEGEATTSSEGEATTSSEGEATTSSEGEATTSSEGEATTTSESEIASRLIFVPEVPASGTVAGVKAHYYDPETEKAYYDANGENEIVDINDIIIPATNEPAQIPEFVNTKPYEPSRSPIAKYEYKAMEWNYPSESSSAAAAAASATVTATTGGSAAAAADTSSNPSTGSAPALIALGAAALGIVLVSKKNK